MNYSIVYSSKTGNTKILADKIKQTLSEKQCVYFGDCNDDAIQAPLIFVGFWTYMGCCDKDVSNFLLKLNNKKIFLFGTSGYGADEKYFNMILDKVKSFINDSNIIIGEYMCSGKMPVSVRANYEKMLESNKEKAESLIKNFDISISHPDNDDLRLLEEKIKLI